MNKTVDPETVEESLRGERIGQVVAGQVKTVRLDKQCAFVRTAEGKEYYFHASHLAGNLTLEELNEGQSLEGTVVRLPGGEKAGAIRDVRRVAAEAPARSSMSRW